MTTMPLLRLSAIAILNISLAAFTAGAFNTQSAHAAAPMVKKSAPGYYRMMLGDFEITALSDGTVNLPMDKLLTNTTPAATAKAFSSYFVKTPVETSVNTYLINTGTKLVMVDTGAAGLFGPTLGNLLVNLKASGYQPDQIDEIYITHMHGDHIGGLMDGDKLAFPNAVVRADKRDADFWLNQANMDKAAAGDKGGFQGAMASINPYVKAGKFLPFEGSTALVPGVKATSAYGHTPGHTTYVVESKGEKLVLWGDLMHVASVQFDHPGVTIQFDSNSKAAAAERAKAYAAAAKEGYLVAATHLSFPGIGHLRSAGKGYTWMPLNYSVLR